MKPKRPSAEIAEIKSEIRVWLPIYKQHRRQMRIAKEKISKLLARRRAIEVREHNEGLLRTYAQTPGGSAFLPMPLPDIEAGDQGTARKASADHSADLPVEV